MHSATDPHGVSEDGLRPFDFLHALSDHLVVRPLDNGFYMVCCLPHEWSVIAAGRWAVEGSVCPDCREAVTGHGRY